MILAHSLLRSIRSLLLFCLFFSCSLILVITCCISISYSIFSPCFCSIPGGKYWLELICICIYFCKRTRWLTSEPDVKIKHSIFGGRSREDRKAIKSLIFAYVSTVKKLERDNRDPPAKRAASPTNHAASTTNLLESVSFAEWGYQLFFCQCTGLSCKKFHLLPAVKFGLNSITYSTRTSSKHAQVKRGSILKGTKLFTVYVGKNSIRFVFSKNSFRRHQSGSSVGVRHQTSTQSTNLSLSPSYQFICAQMQERRAFFSFLSFSFFLLLLSQQT